MIEIKNLYYGSTESNYNCEINHPKYGWIPFTVSSEDTEEFGKKLFKEIQDGLHGEPQTYIIMVDEKKVI